MLRTSKPVLDGLQKDWLRRQEQEALKQQLKAFRGWQNLLKKHPAPQAPPQVPGYAAGGSVNLGMGYTGWQPEQPQYTEQQLEYMRIAAQRESMRGYDVISRPGQAPPAPSFTVTPPEEVELAQLLEPGTLHERQEYAFRKISPVDVGRQRARTVLSSIGPRGAYATEQEAIQSAREARRKAEVTGGRIKVFEDGSVAVPTEADEARTRPFELDIHPPSPPPQLRGLTRTTAPIVQGKQEMILNWLGGDLREMLARAGFTTSTGDSPYSRRAAADMYSMGEDSRFATRRTLSSVEGLQAGRSEPNSTLQHEIGHQLLMEMGIASGTEQHRILGLMDQVWQGLIARGIPLTRAGLQEIIAAARRLNFTGTTPEQDPQAGGAGYPTSEEYGIIAAEAPKVIEEIARKQSLPGFAYGGQYDLLGMNQPRQPQYTEQQLEYMRIADRNRRQPPVVQNQEAVFRAGLPGSTSPLPPTLHPVPPDPLEATVQQTAARLNPAAAAYEETRTGFPAIRPSNYSRQSAWASSDVFQNQAEAFRGRDPGTLAAAALAKLSDEDRQAITFLAEELEKVGATATDLDGYFRRKKGRKFQGVGQRGEPVEYAMNAARERLQLVQEKQREVAGGKSPEVALQELAGTLEERETGGVRPLAFNPLRTELPAEIFEPLPDAIEGPARMTAEGVLSPLGIASAGTFGAGQLLKGAGASVAAGAATAPLGPIPQQIAMTAADVAIGGPSRAPGRVADDIPAIRSVADEAGALPVGARTPLEPDVPRLGAESPARAAAEAPPPPELTPTARMPTAEPNYLLDEAGNPVLNKAGQPIPTMGGGDPVSRLTEMIRAAKPLRSQTERLMSQERARRAGVISGMQGRRGGRGSFYQQLGQLKGELPKVQFTPPESLLHPEEMDDLFNMVWTHGKLRPFQKISTATALNKTLLGQIPTRGEIASLEEVFGKELAQEIMRKRPLGQRVWENLMDTVGMPRTLLSAFDLSAPLRQGLVLSVGHPITASKSFGTMLRAAVSEKYAGLVDDAIRFGPNIDLKESSGLYLASWKGVARHPTELEEAFMSRLADKIPGVRMSQRAYVTYLNKLRSDVFDNVVTGWAGKDRTHRDYEMLSRFINHATGRGDIPKQLTSLTPLMNVAFFSPRLVMSRFQLPADLLFTSQPVRTMVAKDLLATVGTGVAMLTLADAAGIADVELDPRSPDFGKMRFGGQRVDFWGGFQPVARYTAQIASGQAKSRYGNLYDIDRSEVFTRFLRSKLSPVASLGADLATGKTFTGDEMSLSKLDVREQLFNRLTPLFIQDMIESAQVEGQKGAMRSMAALFGVNVQAYKDPLAEAFAKYYPDLAPYDPEKHSAIIDTDERLRSLQQPGAKEKEVAKIAEDFATSLRVLAGPIRQGDTNAGRIWRDEYSDFQKKMVGATAAEYYGTEFPSPDTAEGKILAEYYAVSAEQFRDPETFEIDWDAFQSKRDGFLTQLPQEVQDAIAAKTKLPEDLQDVEGQYRQARELRNQLGDISPIKGVTVEQYDGLQEIWRLATELRREARRKGQTMDTQVGIRRAASQLGVSNALAIKYRAGTTAREKARNPEYVSFLVDSAETPLALFYPELYTANWIIDAVNRKQGKRVAPD